ncbi:MAG TPA: sulfur carrier protein ThiS [Pseudonocardiaceae bacterium]|jgi:sulfur carrier protein
MKIQVNGEHWELPDGSPLGDVLHRLGAPASGVAVALDGAVVPRASWASTELRDGSSVEVFTAVQGG